MAVAGGVKELQVIDNQLWEMVRSGHLTTDVDEAIAKLERGQIVYCHTENVESIRQKLQALGVYIQEAGQHEAS